MEAEMGKKPRIYSPEFKEQAVELAKELNSIASAARKLGIAKGVLHTWAMAKKWPKIEGLTIGVESPEDELKRLRKENQELKKANLILKSAAAFFSQDHLK
jgi:transposase